MLQGKERNLRCSDKPKQYLPIHVALFIILLLPLRLAPNTFVEHEDKAVHHHSEPAHSDCPLKVTVFLDVG